MPGPSSRPPAGADAGALAARKRALRAQVRGRGARDREGAARACLAALLSLPELRGPGTICLFAAFGDEVPVERAFEELRACGWSVVFPRVEGETLVLHEAVPDGLVPGPSAVREPSAAAPSLEPEQVDVFLVPGLLFASDGTRLGRGGGHYDRLLARARSDAVRIGICYADRVRDSLPSAPHDVAVHVLVTDRTVLRCGGPDQPEDDR